MTTQVTTIRTNAWPQVERSGTQRATTNTATLQL